MQVGTDLGLYVTYKAESAGRRVVLTNPAYTSLKSALDVGLWFQKIYPKGPITALSAD
jgi:hypothetical protein